MTKDDIQEAMDYTLPVGREASLDEVLDFLEHLKIEVQH